MMGASRFFLVLPANGPMHYSQLADSARLLVDAARNQARDFVLRNVEVLAVNVRERFISHLDNRKLPPIAGFLSRDYVFMNAGCLLSNAPPFAELLRQAQRSRFAWIGEKSSEETHAFAISLRLPAPGLFALTKRFRHFWHVLARLTACAGDVLDTLTSISQIHFIPPGPSSIENSLAMAEVRGARSRRWANSPSYINTAMREILSNPQDPHRIGRDPVHMLNALLAQRDVSQVPWIFNTLANEIEHRQGRVNPQSFPPEIHLSTTGVCNLECRFCSNTHDIARSNFVNLEEVANIDALRNVQTFRLSAGLGEPTVNKHLPAIIKYITNRFPHLGLNLFTNGLLLNHPGLLEALIERVRWISVSLNAATRSTWREVCKNDQFDLVCHNVSDLHREKHFRGSLWPLVYGSMVLTGPNIADLPRMPALCRELGVDRFTVFPFFALGYGGPEKYGAEMALEAYRDRYDAIYGETVSEAKAHGISIELPPPTDQTQVFFGSELRPLYDFARIEANDWPMGKFLTGLNFDQPPSTYCHFLWRCATIESTNNTGHSQDETHFLYPCLGPLSSVDLSRQTAFRFPDIKGFLKLWQNPVFTYLRKAQHEESICEVCDICRLKDTRNPSEFALLERVVGQFAKKWY